MPGTPIRDAGEQDDQCSDEELLHPWPRCLDGICGGTATVSVCNKLTIMHRLATLLILVPIVMTPALAQSSSNPLVGRWDFNITSPSGTRANWLGVKENDGKLEIWFQPTGGNVYQVKDFK